MTASGRKLPFISLDFQVLKRPLLVKADVQHLSLEESLQNVAMRLMAVGGLE